MRTAGGVPTRLPVGAELDPVFARSDLVHDGTRGHGTPVTVTSWVAAPPRPREEP
ncbi:hypothetical protein [Streptomyces sp. CRN 30]|uniref:hypothetical protein n=1 Tax=Streptomyces sp. CRN 30 TaxID=3075613 RepID=UPI002A810775|nr:hypothetical protein [Streptomyces sp. CRN 30]